MLLGSFRNWAGHDTSNLAWRKEREPMLDIEGLLTSLAQSRKVFHSEADF